jgi:hypothetical protein
VAAALTSGKGIIRKSTNRERIFNLIFNVRQVPLRFIVANWHHAKLAARLLKAELPKKVIRSYTGTKLVFSA